MDFFVDENKLSPPSLGVHSIFNYKSADSDLKDAKHNDEAKDIMSEIRGYSPFAHHYAIETHKECCNHDDGSRYPMNPHVDFPEKFQVPDTNYLEESQ